MTGRQPRRIFAHPVFRAAMAMLSVWCMAPGGCGGGGSSGGSGTVPDELTYEGPDQQWTVTPAGTIVGVQSGLCLSVLGAATANDATADLYTCNGSGSESWSQRPAA